MWQVVLDIKDSEQKTVHFRPASGYTGQSSKHQAHLPRSPPCLQGSPLYLLKPLLFLPLYLINRRFRRLTQLCLAQVSLGMVGGKSLK